MKKNFRALVVIGALLAAQFACNMPSPEAGGGIGPTVSGPNQTLTALFSVTPGAGEPATSTPTLPPIITATPAAGEATAPDSPTATSAPQASAPIATSAPASTNTPAPTATIPNMRPRAQVIAKFLSTPPVLDGDWSEWKDITKEYPATRVVWGASNWTDEDDLAGSFHVGWDNNNLYIAVKVRDDVYVQNATGENIFKGDSIEILLDTNVQGDYYYSKLSADDFQLGISPGRPDVNGTKEAYLWMPSNIAGPRTNVTIASRKEDGVYRVEAAIPWSVFETKPSVGTHMGFSLSISDNDDTGSNVQQSMVSNNAERSLTDPTTWGDIFFTQ